MPKSFSIAIGTDVTGEGDSDGLYQSSFDPGRVSFGRLVSAAKFGSSATFLTLHPLQPLLYAVGWSERYPDGSVALFRLGQSSLVLVAEASSGGTTPCHLAIVAGGTVLALANYDDGTVSTLTLDSAGTPKTAFTVHLTGGGPNRERQEGPHPHGVYFRGGRLHVPDLGLDKIHTWSVNRKRANFETEDPVPWCSEPGAGPRHMDFSPDGRHAYVVHELTSTVTALEYDAGCGRFRTIHSVSTPPNGFVGANTTAEIAVHPNGRFVYASNRGHDTIAVFRREMLSGRLECIAVAPAGGANPRHFSISPEGLARRRRC
jgi:6-phosphogluconolactonase